MGSMQVMQLCSTLLPLEGERVESLAGIIQGTSHAVSPSTTEELSMMQSVHSK